MTRLVSIVLVGLAWTSALPAQDRSSGAMECKLALTAAAVETPVLRLRLLPAEYDLRDGNAAPILLRLPWDQTPFLTTVVPKFAETLEIPFDEPERIRGAGEGLPERMYSEIRRAAYRRTADWEYPIREQADGDILLPDIQGSRDLVMRGLAVRVRFQIVQGQFAPALEGIQVGLANARHYARTPFIICQLAAESHANLMVDRLEELIRQPGCPNLYWALTALPTPFIPFQRGVEFERQMLANSIAGLNELERMRTPEQWEELLTTIRDFDPNEKPGAISGDERRALVKRARAELPQYDPERSDSIASFGDAEVIVRWILARRNDLSDRMFAYASLAPPAAIEKLRTLEAEMAPLVRDHRLLSLFLLNTPTSTYLALTRFDRRIAALRVVEGLRHYAATHDGTLPERLEQMTGTPAPLDPASGLPFEYKPDIRGGLALVRARGIKSAEGDERNAISLQIKLKSE